MIDRELIMSALKTIKNVCEENENCEECPLRNYHAECEIRETLPLD